MARDITIRYVGDSSSAERASRRVQDANERMGRNFARVHSGINTRFGQMGVTFRRFGSAAALGLAGVGVAAVKFGADFVKAAEEAQKITRQTNAVIESTGGVARITATHVSDLADALSKKAGVDDELIQSGENVLLTFTNIRNEVGKGNDIFDQATTVALDMSTALGTDLQGSVIQVGKALQDPIKGIGALRRVGVNFSTDQVEMIKKLVETGDTLGAQRIILQELTTEFGGSAEAQATASGKLGVAWDNLKEKLGAKLLPVVNDFSTWLQEKGIPLIESFAGWIEDEAIPAVKDFGAWVKDNVLPPLGTMGDILIDDIVPALQGVASWINDHVLPAFEDLTGILKDNNGELKQQNTNWTGWAVAIGAAAGALGLILAGLAPLAPAIKVASGVFGAMGAIATNAFTLIISRLPFVHIATVVFLFRDQIVAAFRWIRDRVVANWNEAWSLVSTTMAAWWAGLTAWLANVRQAWSRTWDSVKTTVTTAWSSIKTGVSAAAMWVQDRLARIWDNISLKVKRVWQGIRDGLSAVWASITGAVRNGVNAVIGVINGLIGGINKVLGILPGVGGKTIPKIGLLGAPSPGRGASGASQGSRGRAAGGTIPPFVTDGPRAIVGEGNRAFPEFVIPTDPKYRSRALALLGQAGSKLMASGGKVPRYAVGGIIDDIPGAGIVKGGVRALSEVGSGIAEFARKGAAIALFGPFNKIAEKAINAIPWKIARQFGQGVRQWLYDWVKGQDDKLPTDGGGGARGRGAGIAGLHEPLASIVAKVIAAGRGAVTVISGWRSRAAQERLYARYLAGTGNLAARPGTSKHERGLAVDYGGVRAIYQRLHRRFGGNFPVRGEPWHGEVPGFQHGGVMPHDGYAYLHRGENVTPAIGARNRQTMNVTIHVHGGDPQATVEALKRYVRTQGPVPIAVRG